MAFNNVYRGKKVLITGNTGFTSYDYFRQSSLIIVTV